MNTVFKEKEERMEEAEGVLYRLFFFFALLVFGVFTFPSRFPSP